MKIQLIANGSTKFQRFLKRWGISFLIDDDVLFDAFGDVSVFLSNIKKFNIDLLKIKHIVISHDDWDHIAGLWEVLKVNSHVHVYVGPHFDSEFKRKIVSLGASLIETPNSITIKENIYTTGELQGPSDRGILYEQSLILKNQENISLITGCAHPHLSHILKRAYDLFSLPIDGVMGGFHLKDFSLKEIHQVIDTFHQFHVQKIFPLHCTGTLATKELKKAFTNNCFHWPEGSIVEV